MYLMTTTVLIIMGCIAFIANRKLCHMKRLPMQWGLSGQVNWTASRQIALAFHPILFAIVSSWLVFKSAPGHEAQTITSILICSFIMIEIQIFHLFMIDKKRSL